LQAENLKQRISDIIQERLEQENHDV